MLGADAQGREHRQGLRRRDDRRDRQAHVATDQRDPAPPAVPEAGVGVARAQVPRRPHRLPREHQGRAAQLLARTTCSPTSRTRPRCRSAASTASSTRPSTARSAASPYGMIVSNYDFGPGPQDIALLAEVRGGRGDGARAVPRQRRPAVLRLKRLPEPAEPQGPQVALRGPAVHQVAVRSARPRTRATSACAAALPAPPAVRRRRRSR